MPVQMRRRINGCLLTRTIGGWVWKTWTFRQEKNEAGRRDWWARDSRQYGERETFRSLYEAVTFAVGVDRKRYDAVIQRWWPSAEEQRELDEYLAGPNTCERYDRLRASVRVMVDQVQR